MKQDTQRHAVGLREVGGWFGQIIRRGARQVIQEAVEA